MGRQSILERAADATGLFDVVHARTLCFFPDLVGELGGDPGAMLARVGLSAESVSDGKFRATYRLMVELMETAAAELDCPDFGMRLATRQRGRMYGPLGLVMRNSKTFGEALDYVGKHTYAHSLAARIWLKRCRSEELYFAGHDILLDRMPNRSQTMEQIMLVGHLGAMEITGGRARARRVHFRHQPVSSPRTYRAYFGCEVRFGENEDGLFFSDRDLASPIVDPDEGTYRAATSFIDAKFERHSPPVQVQARGVIKQYLGTPYCTNSRIAAELKLHPRTLHRRLKAEGTSFQQVKDEVRRDALIYYLQETDLDLIGISERLGFAEQSVMTRTCNRWFSAPPTKLRAQGRDPARSG